MLHYEPETGVFRWKVWGGNRARAGSVAGCLNRRGYRLIRIDGRMYLASASHGSIKPALGRLRLRWITRISIAPMIAGAICARLLPHKIKLTYSRNPPTHRARKGCAGGRIAESGRHKSASTAREDTSAVSTRAKPPPPMPPPRRNTLGICEDICRRRRGLRRRTRHAARDGARHASGTCQTVPDAPSSTLQRRRSAVRAHVRRMNAAGGSRSGLRRVGLRPLVLSGVAPGPRSRASSSPSRVPSAIEECDGHSSDRLITGIF
jgi:hypothetical protein